MVGEMAVPGTGPPVTDPVVPGRLYTVRRTEVEPHGHRVRSPQGVCAPARLAARGESPAAVDVGFHHPLLADRPGVHLTSPEGGPNTSMRRLSPKKRAVYNVGPGDCQGIVVDESAPDKFLQLQAIQRLLVMDRLTSEKPQAYTAWGESQSDTLG